MEIFEVHITGDSKIIEMASYLNLKTIQVDLFRPDKSYLRTEYMTSHVFKLKDFEECKKVVDDAVAFLSKGSSIIRTKIESPYYAHYADQSCYIESHFDDDSFKYPTSRNKNKIKFMGTDREYQKEKYESFRLRWSDIEICLFDSFVEEDSDWLNLW